MQIKDANNIFWAATCPHSDFESGEYYTSCRKSTPGRSAQDASQCGKLWDILSAQAGVDGVLAS